MQKNKIKKFFEPALSNKIDFLKAIASGFLQSIYVIINIYFIQRIIFLIENELLNEIGTITLLFFIFNIIYFILSFFSRRWSWADLYYSNIKTLNTIYMKKFNHLDNTSIETLGTGKIISILSKGFENWSNFLVESISIITRIIVSVVATFIILQGLGSIYIITFFLFFIIIHILLGFLNKKSLIHRVGVTESKIDYDKQLVRMIMSKFEILQNNKIKEEIHRLNSYTNDIIGSNNKLNNYLFSMFTIPECMLFIVYLSVLIILRKESIDFSGIVSIFLMLGVLKEVLNNSIGFFKNFTKSFYSIEKVWDFFENTKKMELQENGEYFVYKNGDITIKNLCFSYEENKVFQNLNLEIKGGQKTAFVGASGSGKTTLIKIISGFLKYNHGDVFIDQQDMKTIQQSSYYKNTGYLSQDPSIFDGTIRENLCYGISKEDISEKKIKDAIESAHCEFIENFEYGLETQVGEKGVRLSGGQKQRLAIAKIFIKNPKIIILDEPTSALDSFSEEKITDSFEKLFIGRTVLIIAHRLQTVKKSDDIIVFDNGKIIERGAHNELVKNNGYYKKMLDLQSGF